MAGNRQAEVEPQGKLIYCMGGRYMYDLWERAVKLDKLMSCTVGSISGNSKSRYIFSCSESKI